MNFLRTLLIILLVYYAVKFVVRLFGPYLLQKAVDKVKKRAQNQYGNRKENTVKKGKTVIDKKPEHVSRSNKNVGEYVDFEEIE